MTIDVQPVIEKANDLDAQVLKMREIEALYVVRLASGKDYSTHFDKKSLAEFQPNKTVSEMLESWEETFKRRHAEAVDTIKTGVHPFRTFERDIMAKYKGGGEYKTGETETVPSKIDTYERRHFKYVIKDMEKCFGKLTFVKIV